MALTVAQKRAQENWRSKNREKVRWNNYKSTAKMYILKADEDELEEIEKLIKERKNEK